jgi:hypothetical protein
MYPWPEEVAPVLCLHFALRIQRNADVGSVNFLFDYDSAPQKIASLRRVENFVVTGRTPAQPHQVGCAREFDKIRTQLFSNFCS